MDLKLLGSLSCFGQQIDNVLSNTLYSTLLLHLPLENGKDKDKKSRVLRKDSVHNFTVAKYEEQYFEATQTTSDAAPPPRKKAR